MYILILGEKDKLSEASGYTYLYKMASSAKEFAQGENKTVLFVFGKLKSVM